MSSNDIGRMEYRETSQVIPINESLLLGYINSSVQSNAKVKVGKTLYSSLASIQGHSNSESSKKTSPTKLSHTHTRPSSYELRD